MTTIQKNQLYFEAVSKWGRNQQIDMMTEEVGELLVALNKFKRATDEGITEAVDNICEEIADCTIMLEQLAVIFGAQKVATQKELKLERLKNLL